MTDRPAKKEKDVSLWAKDVDPGAQEKGSRKKAES
jgi:hypothetical protein